jgi:hypothetical protein
MVGEAVGKIVEPPSDIELLALISSITMHPF